MLLIAEAVTRIGGTRLVALAAAGSEIDRYNFAKAAGSRLNHALVVLFLGGITAMIMFGRTLPRRAALQPPDPQNASEAPEVSPASDAPRSSPEPESSNASKASDVPDVPDGLDAPDGLDGPDGPDKPDAPDPEDAQAEDAEAHEAQPVSRSSSETSYHSSW
jgi:hypothetical protein